MVERKSDLRVMLDANILIAGSIWPRWSYEVLAHAAAGDFQVVLSPYIISQAFSRLVERFPDSKWRLDEILELPNMEIVKDPARRDMQKAAGLVRDETDIPVALAAINSKVDYLVSEDKDLAVQNETTAKLREHLAVMLAGTFLREVMGWTSKQLEQVRRRTWKDLELE